MPGKHEVQQDKIGPAVADGPQGFFSRGRPENLVPLFFQVILEQFPDILFILHHQNGFFGHKFHRPVNIYKES